MVELSREHGFAYGLSMGTLYQGWVLAAQGKSDEGIAQMRQGLAAARAQGTELARPWGYAHLAEAYGQADKVEEGLAQPQSLAVSAPYRVTQDLFPD